MEILHNEFQPRPHSLNHVLTEYRPFYQGNQVPPNFRQFRTEIRAELDAFNQNPDQDDVFAFEPLVQQAPIDVPANQTLINHQQAPKLKLKPVHQDQLIMFVLCQDHCFHLN